MSEVKLHLGDCLEYMRAMPDKSVDAVITDPPYGIDYQSNMRVVSGKFSKLENDDNETRLKTLPEILRVLKEDNVLFWFCSYKNFAVDMQAISELLAVRNVIVWNKGGGGIGDLAHSLSTDYELGIVAHKGKCKIKSKRYGSVWNFGKVNASSMVHPTEKPIPLMARVLDVWAGGDAIVLDPFMGSGTTGVACVQTGRNFIGCELDPEYFSIAEKRIADAQLQTRMNI